MKKEHLARTYHQHTNSFCREEHEEQETAAPFGGVPHERTIIEEETLVIEGTSIPLPETSEETETTVVSCW